jgi:opacity protein-like surface antigen
VGAAFGATDTYKKGDTGAGGIGAALRFRPTPRFALEISLDAMRGKDANGFNRSEVPLSFVGLLYLNPRSRAQVYLLGGFGFSSATVDVDNGNGFTHRENYSYFGGLFGGGIEFRVGKKVALNFDVRGFVRGRTDEAARQNPEFTAADGRTTNTSGGALFTGGLTFYF